MSRMVSVVVKNVVADREILQEAKRLLEKYGVQELKEGFLVGRYIRVGVENGMVNIRYDADYLPDKKLAERVMDAILAASVAKSARLLGARVSIRETEEGYEVEGWA